MPHQSPIQIFAELDAADVALEVADRLSLRCGQKQEKEEIPFLVEWTRPRTRTRTKRHGREKLNIVYCQV
jgi:hypothetical protein